MFLVRVYLSPIDCDPASQFMCADQSTCVDICFHCEANHFPDCAEGSEERKFNITDKTVSAVVCGNWRFWVWKRCIHYIEYVVYYANQYRQHGHPFVT